MKNYLSTAPISTHFGLLVLRLMAGGAMLTHGFLKFQKVLEGNFQFGDPIGLGPEVSLVLVVFSEFVCSILLILGLTTRFALISLFITVAVAFFVVHGQDPFSVLELPFFYLGIYVSLFLAGPGKLSIDGVILNKRESFPLAEALS